MARLGFRSCLILALALGWGAGAQETFTELVAHGTPAEVRATLAAGAEVESWGEQGMTPLMHAAERNPDPEVVRLLLAHGADVNKKSIGYQGLNTRGICTVSGRTPLMFATASGNPEVVRVLLDAGADVNAKSCNKDSAVLIAASRVKSTTVLELLVQAEADVNDRSKDWEPALLLAVRRNDPNIISTLLSASAEVNARNLYSDTALTVAVREKRGADVIQMLLDAGADANMWGADGLTALMTAEADGAPAEITEMLRKATTLTLTRDEFYDLAAYGSADEVRAALEQGAQLDARNPSNPTVFTWSVMHNRDAAVIQTLIDAGARADAIEDFLWGVIPEPRWEGPFMTPLMYAAKHNPNPLVIAALLRAGARINAKDIIDRTPLMHAAEHTTNPHIIHALLDAGADPTLTTTYGDTALSYARDNPALKGTDALTRLEQASR
jgi:uncharacterized protein